MTEPTPGEATDAVALLDRAFSEAVEDHDRARLDAQQASEAVPPPTADEGIPDPDDAPADWAVDGIQRAARTVARCRLLRSELAEVRAVAQAEIDRWQEWATVEETRITSKLSWLEAHLEGFAQERRLRDPDAKTLNLPGARITTRDVAGKWVVDEAAAQAWAAEHEPELIAWKPRFDLAQAKRRFKAVDGQAIAVETGVVIIGVAPEPDRTAVSITYLED